MKSSSAQAPRLHLLILSCPLLADFVAKISRERSKAA
jgi:hypothetical protein